MIRKTVTIRRKGKKENNPVMMLVETACRFSSRIQIECGTRHANAKSLMGVMGLDLCEGDTIAINAVGVDKEQAVEELEAIFA